MLKSVMNSCFLMKNNNGFHRALHTHDGGRPTPAVQCATVISQSREASEREGAACG